MSETPVLQVNVSEWNVRRNGSMLFSSTTQIQDNGGVNGSLSKISSSLRTRLIEEKDNSFSDIDLTDMHDSTKPRLTTLTFEKKGDILGLYPKRCE